MRISETVFWVGLCVSVGIGAPFMKVLCAHVDNFPKCCAKDEELSVKERKCVPQENRFSEEFLSLEGIDLKRNDSTSAFEWLPPQLRRDNRNAVTYGSIMAFANIIAIDATDEINIQITDLQEPLLLLRSSRKTLSTKTFCFDTTADTPMRQHVVLARLPKRNTFQKCCLFGRRLTPDGTCEVDSENDWLSLSNRHTTIDGNTMHPILFLSEFCVNNSFEIIRELSEDILQNDAPFSLEVVLRNSVRVYCMDVQRTRNGRLRDVLANCEWPSVASVYRKIRPLHLLAAAVLAAAIVVLLRREEMRRTQGLALACHATCLMITNVLQATWFFTPYNKDNCLYYAYPIYFFLLAGAFWLNAVAANMAYRFRQPLGVLAHSGDGGWLRLALLSAYAWGFPAALTAFAAHMKNNDMEIIRKGFVTPFFFETRTCSLHDLSHGFIAWIYGGYEKYQMGSLLYYYTPLTILVVANGVCLILTLCKIRELRGDSSFLQSTSRPQRSAVLYVKLLLSAGVLELLLEAIILTATAIRPNADKESDSIDPVYEYTLIFATVTMFVDLSRALAVLWMCARDWEWMKRGWERMKRGWTWLWGWLPKAYRGTGNSSSDNIPLEERYTHGVRAESKQ